MLASEVGANMFIQSYTSTRSTSPSQPKLHTGCVCPLLLEEAQNFGRQRRPKTPATAADIHTAIAMRVDVDDMPAADRRGAPIVRQHWHLGTLPVVDDLSGDGSHRHGFQKLKEACFEFVSGPENYGFVRMSKRERDPLKSTSRLQPAVP